MTLQKTLDAIVSAFNGAQQVRTTSTVVRSIDGRARINLADTLPAGAHAITVSRITPGNHRVGALWLLDGTDLDVALVSHGVHFTPQPWDASAAPVTLEISLAFTPAPVSVPDAPELAASGLLHFGADLPARKSHVVTHGLNRTHFVERLVDGEGRTHFADVEALDPSRVRVTLAEAVPVRLDLIFMPDDAGQGA